MSKVAIVTDSISCLPAELLKEYAIRVVPVGLVIDRKVYRDTELSNEKFWELFYTTQQPITTNAGNPADFEATFAELAKVTDGIVCILVSKALSATYSMAVQAGAALMQKMPNLKIEVVDSKSTTGAQGFIVLEAAKAARVGQSITSVVKVAEEMVSKVKFVSALSTLKYLIRCGRAPKSAFIGDWLQVKPILGMLNCTGLVENLGRERGMPKAIEKMLETASAHIDPAKPLHLFVHYSDDKAIGQKILDTMTTRYNCVEIYLTPYTAVMTSQTGPVVAVAFYQ
jgi:DegV family protein with EDD domain